MFKRHFVVRKKFMILMTYLLIAGLFTSYGVDRYRFKGPKYQAPETIQSVNFFKKKCLEYKIEDICAIGFQNLVRIDVVDSIWYQTNLNQKITAIGLTEYSLYSPLTKISVDKKYMIDKVIFDSTIIHELGHAVLYLDHTDDKPAIMNTTLNSPWFLEQNYEILVNEMFQDFANSLK